MTLFAGSAWQLTAGSRTSAPKRFSSAGNCSPRAGSPPGPAPPTLSSSWRRTRRPWPRRPRASKSWTASPPGSDATSRRTVFRSAQVRPGSHLGVDGQLERGVVVGLEGGVLEPSRGTARVVEGLQAGQAAADVVRLPPGHELGAAIPEPGHQLLEGRVP